jgi:hypothetical protein
VWKSLVFIDVLLPPMIRELMEPLCATIPWEAGAVGPEPGALPARAELKAENSPPAPA